MDLLAFAKNIADRVEAESVRANVPVAVCVIDIHGNIILKHRMNGAPTFSIDLSERKAYTSALMGLRTAELSPLVQPGQPLFPLMGVNRRPILTPPQCDSKYLVQCKNRSFCKI
jgi:uncharacterized protein GlcG (DUF336 family)